MPFNETPNYGSENDDNAPVDYMIFDSVSAAERRRQSEPIHPGRERAASEQPAESAAPQGYETARRDPLTGNETRSAAHIAYPRPRDNGFAQTPTYAPRAPQRFTAEQTVREPASAQRVKTVPPPSAPAEAINGSSASAPERTNRRSSRHVQPDAMQAVPANGASSAARTAPESDGHSPVRSAPETGRPLRANDTPAVPTGRVQPPAQAAAGSVGSPAQETPEATRAERVFQYNGSQYAVPPTQEIPDWLKAAQQNKVPYYANRRPPRVEPAPYAAQQPVQGPVARRDAPPSRAEAYAAAGYPPELVASQRGAEEESAFSNGYGHRSHGAQYAAPRIPVYGAAGAGVPGASAVPSSYPPPREDYARRQAQGAQAAPRFAAFTPENPPVPPRAPQGPYADPEPTAENPYAVIVEKPERRNRHGEPDEPETDEETEDHRPRIPFLGIAVFLAAMLVLGLVIGKMSFQSQTQSVLTARAEAVQRQIDKHPYSYRELIEAQAAANNLHPAFVAAIVLNESSFNPNAESSVGARGLMQLMPDTAEWVHGKIDADADYSFDHMYDADTNVRYACWYLAYLSDQFYNDPVLVSAAFHAGQTTVRNWLNNSLYSTDHRSINLSVMEDGPTKNYAIRVVNAFAVYKRLYYEGGTDEAQAAASAPEAL